MNTANELLTIRDLSVNVDKKCVLQGIDLSIKPGEIHVLMGPNGSGKSSLAHILAGVGTYEIKTGSIQFAGEDLLNLTPDAIAQLGLFLGFQYPVAIPGLSNIQFLKTIYNAQQKKHNKPPVDSVDFLNLVKEKMQNINMPQEFLKRSLNDGFSGGEKKRNEILQMLLLEPKLAILDEIDSGLDIDALKNIAQNIQAFRIPTRSMILITHYQRLLDYIPVDYVHVLYQGKIIHSGNKNIVKELEHKGYQWLLETA